MLRYLRCVRRSRTQEELRRELSIRVPGLSVAHDGLRIAHLSDLHAGWATSAGHLRSAMDQVNAARPDLIVMTGDYVCLSRLDIPRLERAVSRLSAAPVLATLGNHDYWAGADRVARALERAGCDVLRNASRVLSLRGVSLHVAGIDDPVSGKHDVDAAFAAIPAGSRPLALVHSARIAKALARQGAGLILSGHHHGGQVCIGGLTDRLGRRFGIERMRGLHQVHGAALYITTGVGNSVVPFRIGGGARPEVAVLTLRADPDAEQRKPILQAWSSAPPASPW